MIRYLVVKKFDKKRAYMVVRDKTRRFKGRVTGEKVINSGSSIILYGKSYLSLLRSYNRIFKNKDLIWRNGSLGNVVFAGDMSRLAGFALVAIKKQLANGQVVGFCPKDSTMPRALICKVQNSYLINLGID